MLIQSKHLLNVSVDIDRQDLSDISFLDIHSLVSISIPMSMHTPGFSIRVIFHTTTEKLTFIRRASIAAQGVFYIV